MPFQTLLQVVEDCDNFPHTSATGTYTLVVGSIIVGRLLSSTVLAIREYSARQNEAPFVIGDGYVTFAKHINTTKERSQVIAEMLQAWREEKKFAALHGWRNELYAAYGDANQQGNIAFVFERAGAPLLGIPSYGVHLNAYVREDDGMLKMWIARRSLTKQTWPGMLDNCVR
ncbi:hypothetical protein BC936DRAFT_147355 [Jimgerdemannia flammicorona]|uniref:DUF4743 domain-containing protein n=1 Tax=Jimgerdemannia flammicorona TaxID=994334 RepID=A0A433D5J4_9FUNG|nr:hypothetical protein BC936DRAFT_147355 [Jimgerdemannia flammicorona]